jgi:hypothetical protein
MIHLNLEIVNIRIYPPVIPENERNIIMTKKHLIAFVLVFSFITAAFTGCNKSTRNAASRAAENIASDASGTASDFEEGASNMASGFEEGVSGAASNMESFVEGDHSETSMHEELSSDREELASDREDLASDVSEEVSAERSIAE